MNETIQTILDKFLEDYAGTKIMSTATIANILTQYPTLKDEVLIELIKDIHSITVNPLQIETARQIIRMNK